MQRGSQIYNLNLVRHNGTGPLNLKQSARFENLATGTYDLESDSGLFTDDYGPQYFDNFGTLRKSGGTGNSTISSILFNNLGGVVDVQSGTLTLANNGSSSNGTFTVAAGAVLDLTGGQSPTWAGLMDGRGAGTVLVNSGTFNANPGVELNFTNGMFQWTGGSLVGLATNLNVISISGSTTLMQRGSQFYNLNLVRHNGSAGLNLKQSARFENLATGTFDLESDSGVFTDDYTPQYFDNLGTLRKSGGTNTSVISITFNNQNGSIEVDRGTLSLSGSNYVQGTGALTIGLGGTNSGQSGSLAISANALLGGPLNVFLTNGYAPAVGDQFQILSCASLSGNFSSFQLPAGFVVTNIGSIVFVRFTGGAPLVVVGNTPGRVSLPTPDLLLFTSASNSTWQVWSATNLGVPNWLPLGSVYVTNSSQVWRDPNALPAPQRFYRVLRSPSR
jgi:hypothetical protein